MRLGRDFALNGSASARVTAVLASDNATPADIVVERTMEFPGAAQPGSHNASGVTQAGLSESLDAGRGVRRRLRDVRARRQPERDADDGAGHVPDRHRPVVRTEQVAPANSRVTFYPRGEHAALATADFSTVDRVADAGQPGHRRTRDVLRRFPQWSRRARRHEPEHDLALRRRIHRRQRATAFETFLLLANTNTTETVATVDYLLDSGAVGQPQLPRSARQRFTVWVDQEGRSSTRG